TRLFIRRMSASYSRGMGSKERPGRTPEAVAAPNTTAPNRGAIDLMLDANRLFPAAPTARAVAKKLYETVRDLPIISPHGHTDPRWFAENQPFANPDALLIQPDHYIFRMLYSQGISLESLGIPSLDGVAASVDPKEVWRI